MNENGAIAAHPIEISAQGMCRLAEVIAGLVFAVPPADLRRDGRGSRRAARARQCAMYLAHVSLGISQAVTARGFRRDRTTIRHGCARIEDARDCGAFDRALCGLEAAARAWTACFLVADGGAVS
jgi:hypothetical protein